MHADERQIDANLVGRLMAAQFPQWAGLSIERVVSAGTDNAIFRLGRDLAVRLPRIHWSAADAEKEHRWLPRVCSHLPVAVPVPIALGAPGDGYPWHWSIVRWLPGKDAHASPPANLEQLALDLARFIAELHVVDAGRQMPADAPAASRGVPLAARDPEVRGAVEQLDGVLDTAAVAGAWQASLEARRWEGPPVWIHGDLQPTNLLVRDGRLTGVVDWGGLGVGDPAADLMPAWSVFTGPSRAAFRNALAVDDATWARGRGWALSVGLIALPYYLYTNPVIVDWARRSIDAVLTEWKLED